ncbi:MAG: hypothetical protein ACXW3K_03210, partial [Brevundimonas sp.]
MKSGLIALIAATAASSLPGAALAQCATVDPVVAPQIRLDPLDAAGPGELVQPLILTFRRTGLDTSPLTIRYQIVDEDSNLRSRVGVTRGPALMWQGEDSSRDIGAFRSEAYSLLRSSRAIFGENDQATQQSVMLRLTDLREDLSAGVYREQFTVRYWCGDDDRQSPYEAQGAVAVSVAVPNVLSASIAGATAHGEIDFVDFAVLTRSLQVSVRSTGPYRVVARSLNGGVMLRDQARTKGDPADTIEYVATFDGEPLSIDGSSPEQMSRAGLLGRQVSLDIEVEDISAKRAGSYADVLLLTLSP